MMSHVMFGPLQIAKLHQQRYLHYACAFAQNAGLPVLKGMQALQE